MLQELSLFGSNVGYPQAVKDIMTFVHQVY